MLAILTLATIAIGLDAALDAFTAPAGLWTLLGALATFLGARAALKGDR